MKKPNDNVDMSAHKREAIASLTPIGQRLFKYIEFDDDEAFLKEIRKHPIGLIFILVGGLSITMIFIIISIVLAVNIDTIASTGGASDTSSLKAIILLAGYALAIGSLIIMAINIFLYRSDVIFITNEKIAEVSYISLFNRRITQLSIGNVEDVTVSQNGILPHFFNFGSLLVETAGELPSPAFNFVPFPNKSAQIVVEAHEEFVKRYGN